MQLSIALALLSPVVAMCNVQWEGNLVTYETMLAVRWKEYLEDFKEDLLHDRNGVQPFG